MLSVEQEVLLTNLDAETVEVAIDPNVSIQVRYGDLETALGGLYPRVPIPVDRAHLTALKRYYAKDKNWERYFFLKGTFPELRQRDASTVYKAQGSSIDTVFIDLSDISTCRNADQAARMLYVAPSRARKRVILYGQLADKFGGLTY